MTIRCKIKETYDCETNWESSNFWQFSQISPRADWAIVCQSPSAQTSLWGFYPFSQLRQLISFFMIFLQSISDLLSECFSLCDKNSCSLCDNLLICGVIIHTVYYTDFKYEVVLEIFSIFSGRQQYWQCELPGGISQWLEIKPTARPNKQAPPPPPPSPHTHTHLNFAKHIFDLCWRISKSV